MQYSLRNIFAKITILCLLLAVFRVPLKAIINFFTWQHVYVFFYPFRSILIFFGLDVEFSINTFYGFDKLGNSYLVAGIIGFMFFISTIFILFNTLIYVVKTINNYGKTGELPKWFRHFFIRVKDVN